VWHCGVVDKTLIRHTSYIAITGYRWLLLKERGPLPSKGRRNLVFIGYSVWAVDVHTDFNEAASCLFHGVLDASGENLVV
jgi:hypothetical protein